MRNDGPDLELCCADEDLRDFEPTALNRRRLRTALVVSLAALVTASLGWTVMFAGI